MNDIADNAWANYEKEKRKLIELNLPADDYEKRLREIARRLGI